MTDNPPSVVPEPPSEWRPVVGVSACRRTDALTPFQSVGEKYLTAIAAGAQAQPLILPALGGNTATGQLLALCDGLLFTGSPSNVEPWRYGHRPDDPEMQIDPHRDASTLGLMREAIESGVPVLAICRGFQELNVCMGGTLNRRVHDSEHLMDHREEKQAPLDAQYGPAHNVRVHAGGLLAAILRSGDGDSEAEIPVNSLHSQGIDELAPGLHVEATAEDGLIEAVSVTASPAFALGVQWHPEWRALQDPASRRIFRAFGDACRARQARKINLVSN